MCIFTLTCPISNFKKTNLNITHFYIERYMLCMKINPEKN